jgi:hypothetical protein
MKTRDDHVKVLDVDSSPRVIPFGEDYLFEPLPPGTRVISAPPPLRALPNLERAVGYALDHPEDADPLTAGLGPWSRVTIAVDDVSLPLPSMRAPDARQVMLEAILERLARAGVDDIEIIMALALHRRMTEAEIRHVVGPKVFNAFYPSRLYNLDAEDPDGMVSLGRTDHGEHVVICRRAVESDLLIYVSITLVPMSGGHKSVTVGLTGYEGLRAHHNPDTIRASMSYMDPARSELTRRIDRMGLIVQEHIKVFHVEATLNNDLFGSPLAFLARDEDNWSVADHMAFSALRGTLAGMPRPAKRKLMHRMRAPYGVTSVQAGETEAVHRKTLRSCFRQYAVPVTGQTDVLIVGVTYVCPYNVNSIMNPLLVHCTALGYLFNMFRGKPLVREGGVIIVCHPLYDEWDTVQHAPYLDFFHNCLSRTRDSHRLRREHEERFARDPDYVHAYRTGHAYHGAHPFYMWYWGENGRAHAGKVIAAGAESESAARILGWDPARSLNEALSMARSFLGGSPSITYLKIPPLLIADVK